MHSSSHSIRADVVKAPTTAEKIEALEGMYAGHTVVIVTAGPSLGDYDPAKLRSLLAPAPVIAVKQAIDIVGQQADFLCFNLYNVRRYTRPHDNLITVFTGDPDSRAVQYNRVDLHLSLRPDQALLGASVAETGRFEEWTLSRTPDRPRGPGIMFESVFFLAQHLGAARVVTIGWDIAAPDGTNRHMAGAHDDDSFFETLSSSADPTSARRRPWLVDTVGRRIKTAVRHARGQTYNLARMQPGEAEIARAGSAHLHRWLSGLGVDLAVVSDRSWADESIPRWTLDDLGDALAAEAERHR